MATREKTPFTLEAPEATEVYLAGSFNDWDPQAESLVKEEGGCGPPGSPWIRERTSTCS